MTLEDYYREIQLRGGVGNPRALIGRWNAADCAHIDSELRQAIADVGFIGKPIARLLTKITNQAKGNAVADGLCAALKVDGSDVTISKLSGGRGYPDRLLSSAVRGLSCCLEIKATSDWQDKDTNRRVITSSYSKLARAIDLGELPSPPCHLMATILYDDHTGAPGALRLDFLEPDSPVSVRLEASTSHSLLTQGAHRSTTIS